MVCIIGPSGSGKSTFLRSLNLLEEVTKGQITVNGYDLTDPKTNVDLVRENIGMVFQHFNLFPHMSVLENIMFAPVEHKLMTREEAQKSWDGIVGKKLVSQIKPMPIQTAFPVVKKTTCGYRTWTCHESRYYAL